LYLFLNNIFGQARTSAALGGYAETFAHFAQISGAILNGGSDLVIGNTFTQTYVHGETKH